MKVFKKISLSDQKIMFENLFVWDLENGDKPAKTEYKNWVVAFFANKEAIKCYIENLRSDINLTENDEYFSDLNNSYKRQITFLTSSFLPNNQSITI